MEEETTPVGVRIARWRKSRSLTQVGLAARLYYSRSHLSQVEAGRKVPSPAFIAAVARSLRVDPAELYGQPYRDGPPEDDGVHAGIAELRRALAVVDVPPDLDAPPLSLDALAEELAQCQRLRRDAHHGALGGRLPAVIEHLAAHVYDGPAAEEARAWRLMYVALDTAGELARRLGYTDLANHLVERTATAAARADDPHLGLMVDRRRSLLMAGADAYTPALRLLHRATDRVELDHPGAAEARGALQLRAAVIAARSGQADAAWNHYGEASEISRSAGSRPLDSYGTNFTVGNLAIHGAALAVELRDYDEARRRDADIGDRLLASVSAERRAHHGVDMARVYAEIGQRSESLRRIAAAERQAPQMVRYHPMARSVTLYLVRAHRALPEDLRLLTARMRAV